MVCIYFYIETEIYDDVRVMESHYHATHSDDTTLNAIWLSNMVSFCKVLLGGLYRDGMVWICEKSMTMLFTPERSRVKESNVAIDRVDDVAWFGLADLLWKGVLSND